jgi:hypothetical protein
MSQNILHELIPVCSMFFVLVAFLFPSLKSGPKRDKNPERVLSIV